MQEHDNDARIRFMGIDQETRGFLSDFWKIVEPQLPEILNGFYQHVAAAPALAKMVGNETPRLKNAQALHWERLFSGRFDDAYFHGVRAIGLVHNKIGLEPRWYIGGYNFVLSSLTDLAIRAYRWSPEKMRSVVRAVNCAVMLDMDVAISVYQEAMLAERAQRGQKLEELTEAFGVKVRDSVDQVASASNQLESTARSMAGIAEATMQQTSVVASAAEEASVNVQTVAAAAEELSSSVSEISRQVAQSSGTASTAVAEAQRANEIVAALAESAEKIGAIVQLISTIAGQTNLLALNATIEAARAGDAGKGFSVVASEVKSLANQTAKATDEISLQVTQIQGATKEAVAAIQGISKVIGDISDTSSAIAASVEEQGSATKEIARNVQEAAAGTKEVTVNIASVNKGASQTGSASMEVLGAAKSLLSQAQRLSAEVNAFIENAKAV